MGKGRPMTLGEAGQLDPRFDALVQTVQEHVNEHGGAFRIVQGELEYEACGHLLPAAIAIDVVGLEEVQIFEKATRGFHELAAKPCAECARLAQLN